MLKLALRTLPLFAIIVGFAMALGAYMNFSGVRGAYLDLIRSRMQMVADDVGTVVDSAVSVGIPPAEQVTLPSLLTRQAEADPLILSIDAVAPDGRILFSSAPDRATQAEPTEEGDVFVLRRPVRNDFDVEVAEIYVRYDRAAPSGQVNGFGRAVLADALPAGLIAVLAGSLAAFLVLSHLHRRAGRVTDEGESDAIGAARRDIEAAAAEASGAKSRGGPA